MVRITIVLLLFSFVAEKSFSMSTADSLWQEYDLQKDKNASVRVLIQLANSYSQANLPYKKDSVLDIAFETIKTTNNNDHLIKLYRLYFENDLTDANKGLTRAQELLKTAQHINTNEWLYEAYNSLSKVYLSIDSIGSARDYINKAFYHVSFLHNDTLKANCMLQYGYCLERSNEKIEAFRTYMNALYMAEKLSSDQLIYKSYGTLASFYLLINNAAKAKEYALKQIQLILKPNNTDSVQLMYLYSELIQVLFHNNELQQGEQITRNIIQFAYKHNDQQLANITLEAYRSYLIEQSNIKSLVNLYTHEYPGELEKIRIKDTSLYYRMMAYISEENGVKDSSVFYYLKTEQGLLNEGYPSIYLSNFYKRFGQFYLRTGDITKAKEQMEKAYEYAKNSDYLPYLVETTHYLDSLNYLQDNLAPAYQYSKLNKYYTERQRNISRADEILKLEIDNEARKNELFREREEMETTRRHNLQYMGMIISIVACFILLLMFSRYKVHNLLIKSLGFFSFIFFFEFIILLADHKIHYATHGEPWKIMTIKIVLIGFLLPFHHWIEGKVVHYLIAHRRVTTNKLSLSRIVTDIKHRLKKDNDTSH